MKTTIINLLKVAVLLSVVGSSAAFAGDKDRPSDSDGWVPVKHLSFSDEDIQGDTMAADAPLIQSVRAASQSSLIEIREGFEAEIVKMMEDF